MLISSRNTWTVQDDSIETLLSSGGSAANFKTMSATWLGEDEHSPRLLAKFEGNAPVLANGDEFVGSGHVLGVSTPILET